MPGAAAAAAWPWFINWALFRLLDPCKLLHFTSAAYDPLVSQSRRGPLLGHSPCSKRHLSSLSWPHGKYTWYWDANAIKGRAAITDYAYCFMLTHWLMRLNKVVKHLNSPGPPELWWSESKVWPPGAERGGVTSGHWDSVQRGMRDCWGLDYSSVGPSEAASRTLRMTELEPSQPLPECLLLLFNRPPPWPRSWEAGDPVTLHWWLVSLVSDVTLVCSKITTLTIG